MIDNSSKVMVVKKTKNNDNNDNNDNKNNNNTNIDNNNNIDNINNNAVCCWFVVCFVVNSIVVCLL